MSLLEKLEDAQTILFLGDTITRLLLVEATDD